MIELFIMLIPFYKKPVSVTQIFEMIRGNAAFKMNFGDFCPENIERKTIA